MGRRFWETNPYGWAEVEETIHALIANDANNDGEGFSWWYYTAGFGAADGSHWMVLD